MCNHNLHFGLEQLKCIKEIEVIVFLISVGSTIVPPSYLPFFLIENEPMHEFFQDVFEVDVSLKVNHFPVLLLITWAIYSCGSIVFQILCAAIIYLEFTVVCITSLMPQSLVPYRGQENARRSEYHVQTTCFGILHETEVLQIYRTLQVFNILSNNIYATILLSAHHPLLMLIMVGLSFLLIRFFEFVYAAGLIAIIVLVTDITYGTEGLLVMKDWHNFGPDYAKTLHAWLANFNDNWHTISHKYGERFYRMWTFYLQTSAGGFEARMLQLWHLVLSKDGLDGDYRAAR
ncbi:unnamed protein product [Orchesella dallaii]|uniref:Uncharacterized protein n=1 Tax=Orchesella dallaii TaxID=48710 RepID=A0ABP1PN77_9HEXA